MAQAAPRLSPLVPLSLPRRGRQGQGQARRRPRGPGRARADQRLCHRRGLRLEYREAHGRREKGRQEDRHGRAARSLCRDPRPGRRLRRCADDQDDRPLAAARHAAPRDRHRRALHRRSGQGLARRRLGDRHGGHGLCRSAQDHRPRRAQCQRHAHRAARLGKGPPRPALVRTQQHHPRQPLFAERVLHEKAP